MFKKKEGSMQMYPKLRDFTFQCRECRFNLWWGIYDPTCLSAKKKKKNHNINQKQYCNKFNKDFKMVHIKIIHPKAKGHLVDT